MPSHLLVLGGVILTLISCLPTDPGATGASPSGPMAVQEEKSASDYLAPIAIQSGAKGQELWVAGSMRPQIVVLDRTSGCRLRTVSLPGRCGDLVVRGHTAYVAISEPAGRVLILDTTTSVVRKEIRVGHTPTALMLGPNARMLYVANRFDNMVSLIDLEILQTQSVKVVREPIALTLSNDGKRLFVANHLPEVRPFLDDENPFIAAEISVIDTVTGQLMKNIELPNGSQSLRDLTVSPNGQHVVTTHVLGNYTRPTWQIGAGLMNRNVVSLLDAETLEWIATIPLDDPHRGAANPWAVAFSTDGGDLLVTHAGTHELSVINYPALLARIATHQAPFGGFAADDLAFMGNIRRRIKLPVKGPRGLLIGKDRVYVSGFFSDSLAVIDMTTRKPNVREIVLSPSNTTSLSRLGEQYFCDASLCFEQWQSCTTCHPDGRSDVLYWDLLNDGLGNTKNTKSLLMSVLTPPVMWRGVRADAATAIAAGIHHIQFSQPAPRQVQAIEDYMQHMPMVPSPWLDARGTPTPPLAQQRECAKCHQDTAARGALSPAACRGKAIFEGKGQCRTCHPHPTFTNGQAVDPGLGSGITYDVPSLIEVWRTAPYLHSGDALTLREAITDFNLMQKRGHTRDLTEQELDDLLAYLQSL